MRALEKNDKNFLMSLLFFCFIAASRMFDHEMVFHSAPMGIMQQYRFEELVQAVYFLSLFLFFLICLKMTDVEKQTEMYYLITLLCVFAVPMFLYRFYFGAMDVYAWILMMAEMVCMMWRKAEWLVVSLAFISVCICPMSFFYCICPLAAFLLYQAFRQENKKYLYLMAAMLAISVIGVGVTLGMHYFTTDSQQTLSWHKFLIILVLFAPYVLIAFRFWEGVLREAEQKMRPAYLALAVSGIPAMFVTAYVQDFARTIFMFFVIFVFQMLFLLSVGDAQVNRQMVSMKKTVLEQLPIPAVLIAYPLVIMTLWVYGPLQVIVETLLGY